MSLFKRKLPSRKPNSSLKPIKITVTIHPPFPVGAVAGLRILQERLQDQFLNDIPTTTPVDWNTITLLDHIVNLFDRVMVDDIMGDDIED